MRQFIFRRLWTSIPVLFLITLITFLMINLAPGDPLDYMFDGERATLVNKEELRKQLGLDQPLPVRYFIWLKEVASGNLGYSGFTSLPVSRVLGIRIGPTLLLMSTAMLIALLIGIPIGIISALKQYSWVDYGVTLFSLLWVSIPGFFIALVALYLFSLKIPIFPSYGMMSVTGVTDPIQDVAWHLFLPATILGLESTAVFMRYTRSSMLEVVRQDYITTARAKGLKERLVVGQHAFRNALLPLLTIIGLQLPSLFGGAVLIETIFGWPGLGRISVEAVASRDYTTIMAFSLITAVLVLSANLLTDISYAYADPRIKFK
jgi:peptide/nickel transport system permease protein